MTEPIKVVRDRSGTWWVQHRPSDCEYWYEGFTWWKPAHVACWLLQLGRVPEHRGIPS